MDFARRHLFLIICGVTSAAGIALTLTGLRAMPKVVAAMGESKRLYQELRSLQSKPVNQGHIDLEQNRIQGTLDDRDRVVAKVVTLYPYEPLVADLFPDGTDAARRTFRDTYEQEMRKLMESLRSGQPARARDIDFMEEKIRDEAYSATGLMSGDSEPVGSANAPARTPANVLTRAGARLDAKARAHLAVAQRIQCYAVGFDDTRAGKLVSSLDFDVDMEDTGLVDAPEWEAVWRAQVGYWIQKDVVDAIAAVNNEAFAAATQVGVTPWVGIMPVKEVISIRVSQDYILPEAGEFGGASPEGSEEALPPGTGETVFTRSESSPDFEVKQFTVKLVMDQRDIPRVVDRICRDRFHTLLRAAYAVVAPNRDMHGKIYGEEPTVNVVMDFETIMLGKVFRPLMPPDVCLRLSEEGDYGIECPEPEEEGGDG